MLADLRLSLNIVLNKTKVIRADLLDFDLDFDLRTLLDLVHVLGNISVLVTFQFW
jgi:hypothetical protein